MRDPPSLYLDFMMNPMRDKPITHAHQWRDSVQSGTVGVREELPLKSEHDSTESNPLSSLLFTTSAFPLSPEDPHWVVGLSSRH